MLTKVFRVVWFQLYQRLLHLRLKNQGIKLHPRTIVKGRNYISKGVSIGADTIVQGSHLDGRGKLLIGNHCVIDQSTILTAQHKIDSEAYETVYEPVIIADYVIIYQKSIILPGIKIGYGAIVGTGSVVIKDVPEMGIVAGNPAKVIRYRKHVHLACDLQRMGGVVSKEQVELFEKRFIGHRFRL